MVTYESMADLLAAAAEAGLECSEWGPVNSGDVGEVTDCYDDDDLMALRFINPGDAYTWVTVRTWDEDWGRSNPTLRGGNWVIVGSESLLARLQQTMVGVVTPGPVPDREACDYGPSIILIVRAWDRVAASIQADDHADMIESMADSISTAQGLEVGSCRGSTELEDLAEEVSMLAIGVEDEDVEDSDYQAVSDAGNAWLKAIGDSDSKFEPAPALPEKPSLTVSQENAISKAQDYLDYTSFSRKGLIDQLEFEGFSKKDATFAVDYLDVDWKEQAAKKAQDYLDYTSFSRKGLISQLEFEGFTRKQAEYGAKSVGL